MTTDQFYISSNLEVMSFNDKIVFFMGNSFKVIKKMRASQCKVLLEAVHKSSIMTDIVEELKDEFDKETTTSLLQTFVSLGILKKIRPEANQSQKNPKDAKTPKIESQKISVVGSKTVLENLAHELQLHHISVGNRILATELNTELQHEIVELERLRRQHLIFSANSSDETFEFLWSSNLCGKTDQQSHNIVVGVFENVSLFMVQLIAHSFVKRAIPFLPVLSFGNHFRISSLVFSKNDVNWIDLLLLNDTEKHFDENEWSYVKKIFRLPEFSGSTQCLGNLALTLVKTVFDPSMRCYWRTSLISSESAKMSISPKVGNKEMPIIDSKQLSIENFLNPEIFQNSKTVQEIRLALQTGRLVSIKNALDIEFANEVYEDLENCDRWKIHDGFQKNFFYQHHNLYEVNSFPPALLTAGSVFGSTASKDWATNLTERDCTGQVQFSASYYMPGDHSTPHADNMDIRQVAFIWHLTKDWKPHWGGSLCWMGTGSLLFPSFNTLNLFLVSDKSMHFVQRVAPWALGKRITVNGWWVRNDSGKTLQDSDSSLPSAPEVSNYCSLVTFFKGY
ncbi:MAG: 2OG-Fe(II) oxygenase [Bdellovibrionales bacterium]|nr:2OG-Fe(II) oxygenase [Bdellovibrionales bacterium]